MRSLALVGSAVCIVIGLFDIICFHLGVWRYSDRRQEEYGPSKDEWETQKLFHRNIEFQMLTQKAFDNYLLDLEICPYCKSRDTQQIIDELTLRDYHEHHMGPFRAFTCFNCTAVARKRKGAHSSGGTSQYVPDVVWHFSLLPESHNKILMPVLDRDEEVEDFIGQWHDSFIERHVEFHRKAA